MTRLSPSSRYAASRSTRASPAVSMSRHQTCRETGRLAGSRSISSQRRWMIGRASAHLVGRLPVEVQLVRVARGQSPGHLGPVAADHDRHARALDRLGHVDGVAHVRALTLERRVIVAVAVEHRGDDAEIVGEAGQPLLRIREVVAVRAPLVALPAGPDAELHPTGGDRIHRRDHLGGQRRIAERRADDDVAEPHPLGDRGQRGQRRERFERDLVGRPRRRREVIEQPDRLESEPFGLARHVGRPPPRVERLPAVVFPGPALGDDRPDPHAHLRRPVWPTRADHASRDASLRATRRIGTRPAASPGRDDMPPVGRPRA